MLIVQDDDGLAKTEDLENVMRVAAITRSTRMANSGHEACIVMTRVFRVRDANRTSRGGGGRRGWGGRKKSIPILRGQGGY